LALVFLFLSMPGMARAYTAEALARFQAGRQYQAAGQLRWAVLSYEAALKADPSLTACYKALGTIYYEAGDHKGALYFYDRYLTTNPNDTATRNFDDSLRTSLGVARPVQASVPVEAAVQKRSGPFNPGFDVRLPFVGVSSTGADVKEFFSTYTAGPGETFNNFSGTVAYAGGVGTDYGLANGFVIGVDLLYGPVRTQTATDSAPDGFGDGGMIDEKIVDNTVQYSFMVTPGWRFKFWNSFVLEPRLGLGVMPASWTETETAVPTGAAISDGFQDYSAVYKASGVGYAIWPEIRGEYLFGQFGLGLSVGYLVNPATTMKYTSVPTPPPGEPNPPTSGSTVQTMNFSTGTMSNWPGVSTSGFSFSIYGVWHFQPLF
jgi:hypothetical protein